MSRWSRSWESGSSKLWPTNGTKLSRNGAKGFKLAVIQAKCRIALGLRCLGCPCPCFCFCFYVIWDSLWDLYINKWFGSFFNSESIFRRMRIIGFALLKLSTKLLSVAVLQIKSYATRKVTKGEGWLQPDLCSALWIVQIQFSNCIHFLRPSFSLHDRHFHSLLATVVDLYGRHLIHFHGRHITHDRHFVPTLAEF